MLSGTIFMAVAALCAARIYVDLARHTADLPEARA
jgi:hypothetical protein